MDSVPQPEDADEVTPTETGIKTVCVVCDDGKGSTDEACEMMVVYDPTGGFVTGGGWILSDAGSYTPSSSLTGVASFGFNAKYKKGANVPDGETEFEFTDGDFDFESTSYEWLVVTGFDKAKFKGEGTVNGAGLYGFMVSVQDNGQGGNAPTADTFRIKIWNKDDNDEVVYDNQAGESDSSDIGTAISGGNIKIHVPKN